MITTYCNKCENKPVLAKGMCQTCYNKNKWANATEEMLQARRDSVKATNIRQKEEGYVPRALRPKQSKKERSYKKATLNKQRKLNRRIILDRIKLESGCVDCGYNERAIALDFDHVKGIKTFNIARAMASLRPFDLILAEVAKCEVRCANCHRITTEDRFIKGKVLF